MNIKFIGNNILFNRLIRIDKFSLRIGIFYFGVIGFLTLKMKKSLEEL